MGVEAVRLKTRKFAREGAVADDRNCTGQKPVIPKRVNQLLASKIREEWPIGQQSNAAR